MLSLSVGETVFNTVKASALPIKETMSKERELYEHNLLRQCSYGIELIEDLFTSSEKLEKLFTHEKPSGQTRAGFKNFEANAVTDITDIVKNKLIGKGPTGVNLPAPIEAKDLSNKDILHILSDKTNAEQVKNTLKEKITRRIINNWQNSIAGINDGLLRLELQEAIVNVKKKFFETPQKVVVLLDDWKSALTKTRTHGDCSEKVARTCDPTAKLIKIQLPVAKFADGTTGYHDRSMFIALKKLNKQIEKGLIPDGINLSSGWSFEFRVFSEHMKKLKDVMSEHYTKKPEELPEYLKNIPDSINHENIASCKKNIRAMIKDYSNNFKQELFENNRQAIKDKITHVNMEDLALGTPFYHWLNESLCEIEKYSHKIPFTVSGGNYGKDYLNPLSLADNVITVGAMDKNGKIYDWSANNTLISNFTAGKFVSDDHKLIPYFLYRQNLWDKVTGLFQGKGFDTVTGTSLSSPFELMMRMKEKINI
ncbi:MAG: S8/S53 family peptidase [bacterium]